jgi:hypothetical protein
MSCSKCKDIKPCPTCGGECRHILYGVWPMDSPYKLPKGFVVSKRTRDQKALIVKGEWVHGYCPDTYHDIENRSGKDRRR